MSKNYQKTLKNTTKWLNRKNNKIQNAYHQFSKFLVEKYDIIANGNIKHKRNLSKQKNGLLNCKK